MPTNPDPDWGKRSLAEMNRAEAELKRVAAEVRAVPGIIANANARLERCLEEDRRLDRERAARKGRTMPETAANEAKTAMQEIIAAGAKAMMETTQEPSRRWVYECAEIHLGELVCWAELTDDDTLIEAVRDAR